MMEVDKRVPGSFANDGAGAGTGSTDYDEAMGGMTPANQGQETQELPSEVPETQQSTDEIPETQQTSSEVPETQQTDETSFATSAQATKSSATSFASQSDAPPPYSALDQSPLKINSTSSTDYSTAEIDKQVASVTQLNLKALEEGQKGVVVSSKWLARVVSRSTPGLKNNEFSKESREGPVGQVDNSDLLPDDAFDEPILKDIEGRPFIPLKPGLSMTQDFEVLNNDAWGVVVSAYGTTVGQKQIERYVRNTADDKNSNLQYELYPPIFTIRKVPQPKQDDEEERPAASTAPALALRLRSEQLGRGQMSPDDAVKMVSSRQEKFQKFLIRSKEAAGIPRSTKVRIFRALNPSNVMVDAQPEDVSAPPTYDTSLATDEKLVVTTEDFNKMQIGKDLETVDAKDETNNSNYNGSSNLETWVLTQSATLIFEEQIGGPAGGEFMSNRKPFINLKALEKATGSKPASAANSRGTSPAPGAGMVTRGRARRDGRTRGTAGLNNLGNTCYMNSALQCIRSCEELAVYFLSGSYKKDINSGNPLGHGGTMAKQYANLLTQMYSDSTTGSVSPANFKKTLGNIAPMFSGYGQQDSQEFLSFLVDALHEDLNRILKKPYNENPDSTDETVKDPQKIIELGEIYRSNHHARNDSMAMDLFSGFYKNTMECPNCDKISITFDPYSLLTVQLPNEGSFQHPVTFVPLRSRPVNHAIDCDKGWTIKMVKEYIASKHSGVDVNTLWMVEVYNHKLYKVFENLTTLAEASIQPNDYLFVYELEAVATNNPSPPDKKSIYTSSIYSSSTSSDKITSMDDGKADCFAVPIFFRQKGKFGNSMEIIFHPMYITVTREEAQDYDIILKKTLIAASRLTSRPILAEHKDDMGSVSGTDEDMEGNDVAPAQNGIATVNGENGRVTDTSGSEDGYVRVSVASDGKEQANGVSSTKDVEEKEKERDVPAGFMEPDYYISKALSEHLFRLSYGASADANLHCTGMSSIKDGTVREMKIRVKKSSRRGSVQTTSSEGSATSSGTGADTNVDAEGSDPEDFDKADIVLGGSADGSNDNEDDDELPDDPLNLQSGAMSRKDFRQGKKGKGKGKNKGRRGKKTYSKKDKKKFGRQNNGGSSLLNGGNQNLQDDEDNPFYIKLGECIVLDWNPEAFEVVFGGNPRDAEDQRGHFISKHDGKGLPTFPDAEVDAKKLRHETRKKHGITLDECFRETGKREVLSEDNAWYCNRCKELRRATKTLEIWTMPDILVVHLKRFGGNRSFRDKIDTLVDYPLEGLDMTKRVGLKEDGKEYVYDLFAVDNHYGGLGGGHYTAYAKNIFDGVWYDYNDSNCSRVSPERAQTSAAAYLLFYRRRSDKPLGPPALQELVNEFRNPSADAAADDAEESDSGEGRLGGPNGFSRGPSSAGTGAGAGSLRSGGASGGAGAQGRAGSRLLTMEEQRKGGIGMLDGKVAFGPQRPEETWSFEPIKDHQNEGGDVSGTLMQSVEDVSGGGFEPADDADSDDGNASTTALMDNDPESPYQQFEDMGEAIPNWDQSGGQTTPVDELMTPSPYLDDHDLYSTSRGNQDADYDTLHLEDTGMIGEYDDTPASYSDPPTPPGGYQHDKTD